MRGAGHDHPHLGVGAAAGGLGGGRARDGQIAGSVSGGCIEDDLIARMREKALAADAPEVVRYGVSGDEAARFGLPCGGTLELVLEPLGRHSRVDELLADAQPGPPRAPRTAAGQRRRDAGPGQTAPTWCCWTSTRWSPPTARTGGC
jgi:xanthine/CO dehydrogenase XdhC/CoxF family maturation factor